MSSLNAPKSDIDHIHILSQQIGALCLSEEYSDVVLVVEEERFPAHKVILAARSEYFRALLFGGMKETKQNEVELKNASKQAIKCLLKYLYTGQLSLTHLKEDVVLDVLGLCHQYGFVDLVTAIGDYLREILTLQNVCWIFDSSRLYELHFLKDVCTTFLDFNANNVVDQDSFRFLSAEAVCDILKRDSFCAPEVDIFRAVLGWSQANPNADATSVFKEVRLHLLTIEELLEVVRPTGVVSSEDILDAIKTITLPGDADLRYRGCLIPEENVALSGFGTTVLLGGMRGFLLNGDNENYDLERGYTRHTISEDGVLGILLRLGTPCIINHIKMLLWDKDLRSYSYYIEVSMNEKDWTRVIDHTRHFCRSWQFLYFPERVVHYIRIVGTNNTVNQVFHVVSFETMYTKDTQKLQDGLIVPRTNIATVIKSASVLEGVSRSRNTLLNGETTNYDWDRGYTCHQLGSGCILVQLGQPYMLSSIKLLLWDLDDRSYSYYIETSVNRWDWEMLVDRTRTSCRSWQTLTFPPRPIVFIKLVGTHNSANEVFHCVHLECPAIFEKESQDEAVVQLKQPLLEDKSTVALD